jgi:hypothetical protein
MLKKGHYYLIASLSGWPGVNLGTFIEGIFNSAPVCGFRPFLDFLL